MDTFTVEQAIEVQTRQLNEWKTVLKPEIHSVLVEYAQSGNEYAKVSNNTNDIIRGSRLSCFIGNVAIKAYKNLNG
jgi:hypothetical protein